MRAGLRFLMKWGNLVPRRLRSVWLSPVLSPLSLALAGLPWLLPPLILPYLPFLPFFLGEKG